MKQHFFIGVDGGATKTQARLEDATGVVLATAISGPANIRLSVTQAWQSINSALEKVLHSAGLSLAEGSSFLHVGMGLAGCEMIESYQAFVKQPHSFTTLVVSSDSHTACLGAHGGDGAIIIAGTGVVGLQINGGQLTKVSGWGFPHDDQGGGAWLGLRAIEITLQWLDGRLPASGLANAVYDHFAGNQNGLVMWANKANSTAFAELAPLVIQQSQRGDAVAIELMQQAAQAINRVGAALLSTLPCSLLGGISSFVEPYLETSLRARLRPCQATPDVGAILLVRNHLIARGTHD